MTPDPKGHPSGTSHQATLYGANEFRLEEAGDIQTDRFGLSTGTCTFSGPKERASAFLASLTSAFTHPYATYLTLERKRAVFSPGIAKVVCEFAGCDADSDYVYEFEAGAKEEPIQTHPAFATLERKYGILTNPLTGSYSYGNDPYSTWAVLLQNEFVRFQSQSPVAGVDAYLSFGNGVWKATKTSPTRPTEALAAIGCISTPPGSPPHITDGRIIQYVDAPSIYHAGATPSDPGYYTYRYERSRLTRRAAGSRNWLYMGFNYVQRGAAFVETHQWLLSGIGGWNPLIYDESDVDFDSDFE